MAADLNLLATLDVLLAEGSVARAAERLHLSPSAMSRALARLRAATGDPLLVRAGRGLAPTPRAIALRDRVRQVVEDAEGILRPERDVDLANLARTFTLRTSDGFVESFGAKLLAAVAEAAPHVRLHFMQKPDKGSGPLREGRVDLETGVVEQSLGPEVRTLALFRDRLVGAVRRGHPLAPGAVTAAQYRAGLHVAVSRTGLEEDAVDLPFLPRGLKRRVGCVAGGFSAALALARASDLIATVPERHTLYLRAGMATFPLPIAAQGFTVSMLWHPRMDADPAHRWLRGCVRVVCAASRRR
ncbi:MAG: LysR family transcriptional regulator [Hyphomonadaceae bacterium]